MTTHPETGHPVQAAVTVEVMMTETQRDEYSKYFGVGFVADEVATRLRPEVQRALFGEARSVWLDWLTAHATVMITRPEAAPPGGQWTVLYDEIKQRHTEASEIAAGLAGEGEDDTGVSARADALAEVLDLMDEMEAAR